MNKPKISIIVPVFNEAKNIAILIKSLLKQTLEKKQYEIIVVDNGSTDQTAKIVKKFPVLYLLENKIKSSYAARNKGIKNAQGQFIAFIDADCIADKNWLKEFLKCLKNKNFDLAAGNLIPIYSKQRSFPNIIELYGIITRRDSQKEMFKRGKSTTSNLFTKKQIFDNIGYFDERLTSAGDCHWTQKANNNYYMSYCPQAKIYHTTRKTWKELRKRTIRIAFGRGQLYKISKNIKEKNKNSNKKKSTYFYKIFFQSIKKDYKKLSRSYKKREIKRIDFYQLLIIVIILKFLSIYGLIKGIITPIKK
jgi:glycosyltransferase AglE